MNNKKTSCSISGNAESGMNFRKALEPNFMSKMFGNVLNFRETKGQDIIDIVYNNEHYDYVSTSKIAENMGILLKNTASVDSENEGSIKLDNSNDKVILEYCQHTEKYKRRFIRAHEIGHLMLHLINSIEMEFVDQKHKSINNDNIRKSFKSASFKYNPSLYTEYQTKYENEADIFAHDILFSEKSLLSLLNLEETISTRNILDYFKIRIETLEFRMKKMNINFDSEIYNYPNSKITHDISIMDQYSLVSDENTYFNNR